jgi:predicted metalloenzyme YecM
MTPEQRFEHIESVLVRIAEAHLELENAQINHQTVYDRFVNETRSRFDEVGEKIANLTILVDKLIERDLQ